MVNILLIAMWFVIAIALILYELTTLNFVSIWFALGALGALLGGAFNVEYYFQILIFALVSLLSLGLLKPFLKKFIKMPLNVQTNVDSLVGKQIKILKILDQDNLVAEAKLDGKLWTIVKENKTTLELNEKLFVVKIQGTKLIVKKEQT